VGKHKFFLWAANLKLNLDYQHWYSNNWSNKDKDNNNWLDAPLISVVVPTYNANLDFLQTALDSVRRQNYNHWELVIADDCSTDIRVWPWIQEYSQHDTRIKCIRNKNHGSISNTTNAAYKLTSGDYVALLDHDDLLWPMALSEVASSIKKHPKVDVLYTDEDKISPKGDTHQDPFFKPDYAPELFQRVNYINHLLVISRNMIEKTGGWRPEYDGAQDWDILYRIFRLTQKIIHIPRVLYSWRQHNQSTASKKSLTDKKSYVFGAQRKVVEKEMKARVYPSRYLGFWKLSPRQPEVVKIPHIPIATKSWVRRSLFCRCNLLYRQGSWYLDE
jgi:glycosyltransferase involved in cell wall biosynthesis